MKKGRVHKCSRKKFNALYKAELRDAVAWYVDKKRYGGGKVPKVRSVREGILHNARARATAACGGDPLYGCPPPDERVEIERIRLDSGGYAPGGRYFGRGAPLFRIYSDGTRLPEYERAGSREGLKAKLRKQCPGIRFSR